MTDSLGRTSITTRVLNVQGDPPPTPSLVVNPAKPVVGQTVTLDGSGSTGPVNPITDYKWDLTGSGTYSKDTGTTPTTTTSFSTAGFHTVGLQVTDSKGVTATTTVQVTVLGTGASSYEDAVNATPGLMHYFKLGESAGPTISDGSGGPSGTVAGGTFGQPGPIQGDPSTAIGFNGSTDFGQIPMNLSVAGTVTVEFWLKWNAYANDDALAMEFTPNFNNQSGGFLVDPGRGRRDLLGGDRPGRLAQHRGVRPTHRGGLALLRLRSGHHPGRGDRDHPVRRRPARHLHQAGSSAGPEPATSPTPPCI